MAATAATMTMVSPIWTLTAPSACLASLPVSMMRDLSPTGAVTLSGCVMRGVDFKTIALWASHRDGGMLVATKYGHLAPGHSESQAAKLNGGASLLPTQPDR